MREREREKTMYLTPLRKSFGHMKAHADRLHRTTPTKEKGKIIATSIILIIV